MKKVLIYTAVGAIAATFFIPVSYVSAKDNNGTLPHIDGNSQFPETRRSNVRHTFRVHIPKNSPSVSQLNIEVPNTLTWSNNTNDIVIANENGKKINASISTNGKSILIAFVEPVASNTKLEIDIKNVKQPFRGNGPVYSIKAILAGSTTEMSIGTARFRVN
ncbi:unknown protein [Rivularia sp. IAM M-261]|nr:unknown protein [Rivularia sp. IAM M-261]